MVEKTLRKKEDELLLLLEQRKVEPAWCEDGVFYWWKGKREIKQELNVWITGDGFRCIVFPPWNEKPQLSRVHSEEELLNYLEEWLK